MEKVTLENVPIMVQDLSKEVAEIKSLLQLKNTHENTLNGVNDSNDLLTVKLAANFLSLAVPTIYSMVSKGELPFMKRSKRLYFSRSELMNYLKDGRSKTNAQIQDESQSYFVTKKNGQ